MKPCWPHQTKEIPKASAAHQINAFGEKDKWGERGKVYHKAPEGQRRGGRIKEALKVVHFASLFSKAESSPRKHLCLT